MWPTRELCSNIYSGDYCYVTQDKTFESQDPYQKIRIARSAASFPLWLFWRFVRYRSCPIKLTRREKTNKT
jgi:hypothetical protein